MIVSLPKMVFALVLIGTGGAFSYAIFARPIESMLASRDWVATPCTITSSRIDASTYRGRSGTRRSPVTRSRHIERITYRYEHEGREYSSKKTSFRSGHGARWCKEHWVERYPEGAQRFCYVNPEDPLQSVLRRGFTLDMWYGFIPLGFGALLGLPLIATAFKRVSGQRLQSRIDMYR